MGDSSRPTWHWDEQAALRQELAEQTETAAAAAAALRAEVARLEAEKTALAENVAFWRAQAEAATSRAQRLRLALARARRG